MTTASGDAHDHRQFVQDALDRYERPLLRYAQRFVGDPEAARDVVQETFLRLCSTEHDRVDGRVGEWLYTVCRNRAIDVGRKERRMTSVGERTTLDRESQAPAPAEVIAGRETRGRLARLVEGLPANQREVIQLKFQDGMSYKEISRITELTVSNVGYLIHVGMKSLRRQLEPTSGQPRE